MTTNTPGPIGSLLVSLTAAERTRLAEFGVHRHVAAGAHIVTEHEAVNDLNVVLSGHAEVLLRDAGGEEHRIATLGPGGVIGEMSLLTGEPASATVRALEPVELLCFARSAMSELLTAIPAVERILGAVVADRLVGVQRRLFGHESRLVYVVEGPTTTPHLAALAASAAWHARRPVLAVVPGGEVARAELVARYAGGRPEPRGFVVAVEDAVFGSLAELAHDLAGSCTALLALVPPGTETPPGVIVIESVSARGRTEDDVVAETSGVLPPTSPFAREIGGSARLAVGRRVGVAFGAGSARGFAHAGVLDVLAARGIPIDTVAGTSIGAAVAGLVGMGKGGDVVLAALEKAGRLVTRPTLSRSSLFSARHLARHFTDLVGEVRLEDMEIPTAMVATDMDSGEEVVFRRGLARIAVMASIAIPGVYPPQHVDGRRLIDGAYVNPVPANVAGALGADVVIAVKLASRARASVEAEAVACAGKSPWIPQVIMRSVDAMSNTVARALPGQAGVVIQPSFAGAGGSLSDFRKGGERFRDEGRRAAEAALAELANLLPWVTANAMPKA